jgi:hypothetical protein
MLVVFPVNQRDLDLLFELLDWINDLGFEGKHDCLIIASKSVVDLALDELHQVASVSFNHGEVMYQNREHPDWPNNPNLMFAQVAKHIEENSMGHWFWCDPDCIPTKRNWIDLLEAEYVAQKCLFMGGLFEHPAPHLNGCMVYPENVQLHNPYMLIAERRPWDLMRHDVTLELGHVTRLIQRKLADPATNKPMSFPDQASLSAIEPETVVFHGCKDGSLIRQLRKKFKVYAGLS